MKTKPPRKGRVVPKWDTDVTMKNLWLRMLSDFSGQCSASFKPTLIASAITEEWASFRGFTWPDRLSAPVSVFKRDYQLENLFKRYRFKQDVYTDADLLSKSLQKFLDTQVRIATPLCVSTSVFRVLQRARYLVRQILGEFDSDRHRELCRFGKRASLGVPAAQAYIDERLRRPITGSSEHIRWFKDQLRTDSILARAIRDAQKGATVFEEVDELNLVFVPKSWKALRSIMPNTTVGSFYTAGLGDYIAEKLSEAGLNIRRLQKKHGKIARRSSVDRVRVTADLSAASDSITRELLRRLLPSRWYRAIMYGAIRKIRYNGATITMETTITMGLGHTFPLQTLIFYALLRAIEDLSGCQHSLVSVYGDDLIYPRRVHKYVAHIFPCLHLVLNTEKTYVDSHFRESCGSDYYRGCDVRPFQPEGQHQLLHYHPYVAFLYKLCNGVLRRWDRVEVPSTLSYLEGEIVRVQGFIHQVPPSYPDTSGVKTLAILPEPYRRPRFDERCYGWHFTYLRIMSDLRVVACQTPYFWEKLRSANRPHVPTIYDESVESLIWRKSQPARYITRPGYRLRRKVAFVASKLGGKWCETSGSSSEWI